MYVRLAFAVAAHLEPEILVVDEVLAVGDAGFQKKCLGKMGDVAKEGRTVLFVSHNMVAVRKLCPSAILLERGCITAEGPTDRVVARYLTSDASEISTSFPLPLKSTDARGQATRLSIFDCNGNSKTRFRLGEPWRMVLEFELYRSVPHVIAAVGLGTIDSVPIITYFSKPKDWHRVLLC